MLLFTDSLIFLCVIVLGAEGSIPSQNTTSAVFLSYDNSNAVYEAWRGPGELSLLFNSHKSNAFLAYQDDGSYNHFDLFLINGKLRARVTFDECQWKQLTIAGNFSDSRWHRVRLARQLDNVTLTVDGCISESIPCRYTSSELEIWDVLYVGGIPLDISMNSLANPGIFSESITSVFQGCIGHVTQTAPGESPKPLTLRYSVETGTDFESCCASGGKCNPIDDVTRKECECPGYEKEELICKRQLYSSVANINLMASSSTPSKSTQMAFSSKDTPGLVFSSQTNVEATSSSKIIERSTPTRAQSASKHAQDISGLKAQHADVAYLRQPSSVPGHSSHSQQLGSVPAPTRSFPPVALLTSVDGNSSAMAKKSNTLRILGSCVVLCPALIISVLSGIMNQ